MRSRLIAAVVVVLLAGGACTGGPKRVSVYGPQTIASSSGRASQNGVPRVMVQMGTNFVDGVLVQFCKDKSCQRGPGRATRTLEGAEPLVFIVDQKPVSARAELRASGAAEPMDATQLRSGTTMLYAPEPEPGSYVVTLTASWKGRSGSWVFRVKVPND